MGLPTLSSTPKPPLSNFTILAQTVSAFETVAFAVAPDPPPPVKDIFVTES